jgi:uncharacterized protein YeeX (DUF496 family)
MELVDNNKKIKDYIKKNLARGYTLDSLKIALINVQGYSRAMVERAIEQIHDDLAKEAPLLKEKPKIIHQIIDEYDRPVEIKKPFWKSLFGL